MPGLDVKREPADRLNRPFRLKCRRAVFRLEMKGRRNLRPPRQLVLSINKDILALSVCIAKRGCRGVPQWGIKKISAVHT